MINYFLIFSEQQEDQLPLISRVWIVPKSMFLPGCVVLFFILSVKPLEILQLGICNSECDLYCPLHPKKNWQQMWENLSKMLVINLLVTGGGGVGGVVWGRGGMNWEIGTNIYTLLYIKLEKAMAPHSSTLAWKIHGRRSLVGYSHGVAKSRTQLSNFIFTFHFHALEKEMATHASVLAWRIPGMGEPGGLPSMGSHRVRHDWSDLAAAAYIK